MLAGFGFWLVLAGTSAVRGTMVVQRFEAVTVQLSFFPGVLCILVGHMVATRERRAGSTELLAAAPARTQDRILGLCLGASGPAAVAVVLNVLFFAWFRATEGFAVDPDAWQVLQGPVTVLGGSLLGIMLAVWLPSRATPVIAMVVMVALNSWLYEEGERAYLAPMVSWADWGPYDGSVWFKLVPGSPFGHVLYLLGLCGLAAAAAVVGVAERKGPAVVAGAAALGLAVAGALVQLP